MPYKTYASSVSNYYFPEISFQSSFLYKVEITTHLLCYKNSSIHLLNCRFNSECSGYYVTKNMPKQFGSKCVIVTKTNRHKKTDRFTAFSFSPIL